MFCATHTFPTIPACRSTRTSLSATTAPTTAIFLNSSRCALSSQLAHAVNDHIFDSRKETMAIQLSATTFARAAEKASATKPAVWRDQVGYTVVGSKGVWQTVRFTARAGALWASCTCYAGSGHARTTPQPCYHVAAVVLFARQHQAQQQPAPHSHACPRCHELYACDVPACAAIDDFVCDGCDK